jgi:tetratricopeptide (TPR) repeat protein
MKLTNLVLLLLFFILVACQTQKTDENLYPENEISLSSTSEEAIQQFVEGLKSFDLGNARKARPLLDKALEKDPNFVSAQIYRTFTGNSAKDFGEQSTKALAMRDKASEGEVILLDMIESFRTGDDLATLEISKKLVEKFPKSPRALGYLAGAYSSLDQDMEARATHEKAISLDPDYLPAIRSLGFSYLFTSPKDFSKAETYMAQLVEKAPENARAHIDLGDCYRAQNDLEKALQSYLKAAELDVEDHVPLMKAGHANSFLGNQDKARSNFQEGRKRSEFGIAGYNFEAYSHLYEGDHKKATAFLQEAAKNMGNMDIPESNKAGAQMGCAFDCAMIAFHHGEADDLKAAINMMKPLSNQIGSDIGSEAAKSNQKANMQAWEAMAAAMEGNYKDAAAKAELIKSTLASINDPQKLRPYHRVHSYVNFQQGNYEKALEHMAELNQDNVYDKYWRAKANEKAGNTEKALEIYKELADYNFNGVDFALIRNELKDRLTSL